MATINHKNFAQTTLGAAVETTDGTSITVTSEAGFPSVDFIISIDTEAMLVTNVSTTTWTVTRGYEGSTAATHLNGAAIYHNWSAAEADSTVHGPASATDGHLAVFDSTTGKLIKDGGAVPAAGLPTTGGTMTGNLIMDNMDVTLVKLLTLHGEIDDENSGTADTIDWNTGAAHKSTLTGNVTLAFTGVGDNLIPTMSSNTAPSGVASANSENTAEQAAWVAFDKVLGENRWWTSGGFPSWLQYQFPTAQKATRYGIVPFYSGAVYPPTAFVFAGSNNGTDWTQLDSRTGLTTGWSQNTMRTFDFSNTTAYLYYRLTISAAAASGCGLTEVGIYAGIVDPASPCFLTLKLVQDATGGRTVTWPATVKGSPVINQAANAVSNVLFYWDGTSYWTLNGLPWVTAPAASNSAGFVGQMAYDASYLYVCTAANTWERAAVATW
jgi:hypothetical protein